MDLIVAEIFNVLMRWIHITSAVVTIGGAIYARLVEMPALESAAPADRPPLERFLTQRYRPLVWAGIAGLLVSGLYNFLGSPDHSRYYHVWFGIKMLLALHIFAGAILAVRLKAGEAADRSKRARRLTGVMVSGLVVLLISAYLRRIY
jgi:uncharacterized membrane protein